MLEASDGLKIDQVSPFLRSAVDVLSDNGENTEARIEFTMHFDFVSFLIMRPVELC